MGIMGHDQSICRHRNSSIAISAAVLFCWVAAALGQSGELPNGVASGDVDQTSAVLWARSTAPGPMLFEYGRDATFGTTDGAVSVEVVDVALPAKVEIDSLESGAQYYLRATDAAGHSAEGRFRTAAESGLRGLRFGASGDSRGDLAPFVSVGNVPNRDLDFFVLIGDTIYAEFPYGPFLQAQARSLADFRARHGDVLTTRNGLNTMAALRSSTAVFATIDDHEITNDFSGGAPPSSDLRFDQEAAFLNETELFSNGLTAFHEYHPIREERFGDTGDPRTAGKRRLYRYRTFGTDAALIILDARSFRDPPVEPDELLPDRRDYVRYIERSFDPTRTMLDEVQLVLLERDLLDAKMRGVTWKFIVVPEPIQLLGPSLAGDRFEGYAFERSRILRFVQENGIANVVFVAADIHASLVNELTYQDGPGSPAIRTSTFEVVTGPIGYAAPFGPTVLNSVSFVIRDVYNKLNMAGQNAFFASLGNALLDFYRLPRIGLEGSPIEADLLDGGYLSVNTYGWTEFEIDGESQCLTVTSWGVPWYTADDVATRLDYVLGLTPQVMGRFQVQPMIMPGSAAFDQDLAPCPRPRAACGAIDATAVGVVLPAFWIWSLVGRGSMGSNRRRRRVTSSSPWGA